MNNDFRFLSKTTSVFGLRSSVLLVIVLFFITFTSFSQVIASIDSTKIKIGEQITYKIEVETQPNSLVVFPEGQTFMPLEMIDSYPIDTIKNKDKFNLIKKYGLTQFDSGAYTIPQQKIIIGDKTFLTDSLKVEVHNVVLDTINQGMYDIKPIIEVKKMGGNWWKYLLYVLLALAIVAGLLYWFIWRKKPLTEAEQIALLPPYDRAKLALKKLDESHYLENEALKDYYSELTFIIRKYLDEKVYDRALESTTDELINRLTLLKEGNQIDISKEDIKNLESILKRADLVKFAKSAPDIELAKLDRKTIDLEIDHVKEALPEPTEEEKLLDAKYKEALKQKKKRKKIWLTVGISVFLLLATLTGFSIKYGFNYVKDTIIGHDSKELLEGEWITSDYGFPPVTITTPKVLTRTKLPLADESNLPSKTTTFAYGTLMDVFSVTITSTVFQNQQENAIDLEKVSEASIKTMESMGVKDILVLRDKFVTPNGAEGLKTSGALKIPNPTGGFVDANYVLLQFSNQSVLQQVVITYPDDLYANQMVERIINSVELKKAEE